MIDNGVTIGIAIENLKIKIAVKRHKYRFVLKSSSVFVFGLFRLQQLL